MTVRLKQLSQVKQQNENRFQRCFCEMQTIKIILFTEETNRAKHFYNKSGSTYDNQNKQLA